MTVENGGHVAPRHEPEKYHHGRTPAAWTGMVIALVGALISTVGFFMNISWPLAIGGLMVMLVGAIVGGIMSRMGFGQE